MALELNFKYVASAGHSTVSASRERARSTSSAPKAIAEGESTVTPGLLHVAVVHKMEDCSENAMGKLRGPKCRGSTLNIPGPRANMPTTEM